MTEEAIHCFIAHPRMGGAAIRIIPPSRLPGTRCSTAMSGNQRRGRKKWVSRNARFRWSLGSATPLTSSVFGSTLLSRIWRPAAAINDCWLVELGTRLGKELENQGKKNTPRCSKGKGEISRVWKKGARSAWRRV